MRRIVYKLISPDKRFKYKISLLKSVSNSYTLTSLYYLINRQFSREQKSVLKGKISHLENKYYKKTSDYLLRRNIHRIEKGLIMKPMRKIFALDYIEETINAFVHLNKEFNNQKKVSKNELKWFHDVLEKYFKLTESNDFLSRLEKKFREVEYFKVDSTNENQIKFVPYDRKEISKSSIHINDLEKLAYQRRSVRWFKQMKVPFEKIKKATEIASLSPSACNRQPFRFLYIDETEKLKKLSSIPMGTKGYNDNIPAMIAVVGDLSAYPFERDRHLIYIDSALATMSFLLGLEVQGISSCVINWPDMEEKEQEISEFLSLKKYERVTMLIAIGYADENGKIPFSQKKSINNIVEYNA